MSEFADAMNKLMNCRRSITSKNKEIEKRREILETVSSTYVSKKKDEAKIEAIDSKIAQKVAGFETTIDYYKSEINNAESRLTADVSRIEEKYMKQIDIIRQKAEAEISKLQTTLDNERKKFHDKFETYRMYCQTAIQSTEQKRDLLTEPLEKKKELLQQTMEKTEEDDKILVRLKVELKQLLESEKELEEQYQTISKEDEMKQEQRRKQRLYEESIKLQEMRQQEAFQRQRELEVLMSQRAAEKAADEEKWERQRQERVLALEEEQRKEKQKEDTKKHRLRFQKEIFPLLSEKASRIFVFLKNSVDVELYNEAMKKETLESCEAFLLSHEDIFELITTFEMNEYPRLLRDVQDDYDNRTLWEQVRFIKQFHKKQLNL